MAKTTAANKGAGAKKKTLNTQAKSLPRMTNFITNSNAESLKKRLIELIQKSDELKFLVGFSIFQGSESYMGVTRPH